MDTKTPLSFKDYLQYNGDFNSKDARKLATATPKNKMYGGSNTMSPKEKENNRDNMKNKTFLQQMLEAGYEGPGYEGPGYEGAGYEGAGYEGPGYDEEEAIEAGFHTDIDEDTVKNENFRKVLFTTEGTQLVLMSLKPGEEIGEETHDGDQFFRFESGEGTFDMAGNEYPIKDGDAVVVPRGTLHNVINTGEKDLKLYALYAPPQHKPGQIDKTKPESDHEAE